MAAQAANSHAAPSLRRELRVRDTGAGPVDVQGGRLLIHAASNNYLGLATDERVIAAAKTAAEQWGAGAGASPLVAGHFQLHQDLALAAAQLKGQEAALLFSSGYQANLAAVTALATSDDVIFCDTLNHASLIDGCRFSKAAVQYYRHDNLTHLEKLLSLTPVTGNRWIVTDGVFSMDGVLAPLAALCELADHYDAKIVLDDAHATGVLGEKGAGTAEHLGLCNNVDLQIGTFSKALGSQGGFIAGPRELIEELVQRARPLIFSTALAPPVAGAALAALQIVREEPERRRRQLESMARLRHGLADQGWNVIGEESAPMCAVIVGSPDGALALSSRLYSQGVLAPAIRPPTVRRGTSRIRLALMATHTDQHIQKILDAFAEAAEHFGTKGLA